MLTKFALWETPYAPARAPVPLGPDSITIVARERGAANVPRFEDSPSPRHLADITEEEERAKDCVDPGHLSLMAKAFGNDRSSPLGSEWALFPLSS